MKNIVLENKGSLITIVGTTQCLGYLFTHQNSSFDAEHGKVEVTPEEATKHNECLSVAELKGLDENCQVGQMGIFFANRPNNTVNTWTGALVSDNVSIVGKKIRFTRLGKTFSGLLRADSDNFSFKRIS
jgi:hypothetical protein